MIMKAVTIDEVREPSAISTGKRLCSMGWAEFRYASGGNPYIAITEWRVKELKRKYNREGIGIKKMPYGYFVLDDRRTYE